MIYESVKANLYILLREVRVLKEEHILQFFRGCADEESLRYLLRVMTAQRFADYDPGDGLLVLRDSRPLRADAAEARVYCFQPVAEMGEKAVRSIVLAQYPFEYSVVTAGDRVTDIAWIPNLSVARLAGAKIAEDRADCPEARTGYLAVVPDPDLGSRMHGFGFSDFRLLP